MIVIISILAGMVMVAMGSARESARVRKTRTTIATLHELLMERYESYRYRRVPISTSGFSPDAAALARLRAIRELMKMEMPDRWSDVINDPVLLLDRGGTARRTALSQAYLRRHDALSPAPSTQFQGAECLYMIITMATGEGEALSFFGDREIGDVDNDGSPEFVDAWGKPISFLRWPAGFVSELQSGDSESDHDPFDPLRRDPGAYRLTPLIYSAGPDELFDIRATKDFVYVPPFDPYIDTDAAMSGDQLIGEQRDSPEGDGDDNWHDNIHNHLIGGR